MKRNGLVFLAFILILLVVSCSITPDEKVSREESLKQNVENFTSWAVQGDFNDIYRLTDGTYDNADSLKAALMKSWAQDASLTGGQIASMAWVNDSTAKVKLNWVFQAMSVRTYSSETFIWAWKGGAWKLRGRALR
jgi:hypothetical protein